jgi:hypothetical protein
MMRVLNFGDSSAARFAEGAAVIHVRVTGQSFDVPLAALDLGAASDDRQIKRALARRLNMPVDRFSDCVIDRHANGNLTIRPEAVFG